MRISLFVVALVAMPLVAVAQGRGQEESTKCNADQAAAVARARAAGRPVPPGLSRKDCAQPLPPPSAQPPSGPHHVDGVVYEELDGVPGFDMFSGEMGMQNVTVELYWNGLVIASAVSDANGAFSFPGLGNATYNVCVIGPSGFSLVQPAPGNGGPCGGAGYVSTFTSTIETGFWAMFGFVMQ
jgi:hypothetical protein